MQPATLGAFLEKTSKKEEGTVKTPTNSHGLLYYLCKIRRLVERRQEKAAVGMAVPRRRNVNNWSGRASTPVYSCASKKENELEGTKPRERKREQERMGSSLEVND